MRSKTIVRRLVALVPMLVLVALMIFSITYLIPGDAAATIAGEGASAEDILRIRRELGLEDPFFVQFFHWLGDVLHGDLGTSLTTGRAVSTIISQPGADQPRPGRRRPARRRRRRHDARGDRRDQDQEHPRPSGHRRRVDRRRRAELLARPAPRHRLRRQPRLVPVVGLRAVLRGPRRVRSATSCFRRSPSGWPRPPRSAARPGPRSATRSSSTTCGRPA